jgi:hypothetical protein
MQPEQLAEEPPDAAVKGGVSVEVVPVPVAAGGAAGEDDIDKHGNNPFSVRKMRRAPWRGGRQAASCEEIWQAISQHNVHFVRSVNGHLCARRA